MTCDREIHHNCHSEAGVKPWGGTHGALLSLAPRAAARDRPECSSFTSDDIVFVIESAATSRSFRRFLGTPGGGRNGRGHATQQINARRCDWPFFFFCTVRLLILTLSEGLQHVSAHPRQAVLGRVSGGGASRGGAYGHRHGASGAVAWRGVRGASGLRCNTERQSRQKQKTLHFHSILVTLNVPYAFYGFYCFVIQLFYSPRKSRKNPDTSLHNMEGSALSCVWIG